MTDTEDKVVSVVDPDAALYSRLEANRMEFLDRARDNAKYTQPALMPPEGHTPGQALYRPYQSVASKGVNSLASRITGTILPVNQPMFRFLVTDSVVEDLAEQETARAEVEKKLNEVERSVQDEIEGLAVRDQFTQAVKQLIVSGNVLLVLPRKGGLQLYRLDMYVVQRDWVGNILKVVIKQSMAMEALPDEVRSAISQGASDLPSDDMDRTGKVDDRDVDVYTVYYRKDGRIHTYQTVRGHTIKSSIGSWPGDKSPIMVLTWGRQPGEDYGRGYVDDYIGDIIAIENLNKNMREGVAASTKFNPLVNPAGMTRAEDIAKSENLEVISGRADDVTMLQFNKQADLQVADGFLSKVERRIESAFMMSESFQRDAERVTAEEIRQMAADLEAVLGGTYALLAQELQMPFVKRLVHRMVIEKKIPDLSKIKGPDGKDAVPIKLVTGVEALGRGNDYTRLSTFTRDFILPFKEIAQTEINGNDLFKRALVSLGIDPDGLLKDEAAKQVDMQKRNAALMQQTMAKAAESAAGPVAKVAAEGMASQMASPPDAPSPEGM